MQERFSIVETPEKGLGVIAMKNFDVGECIFTDYPFVSCLDSERDLNDLTVCNHCFRPTLPTLPDNRILSMLYHESMQQYRCRGCDTPYCSDKCSRRGQKSHICPNDNNFRELMKHPLWKSSTRFRLYCAAIVAVVNDFMVSDVDGLRVLNIMRGFAAPCLGHNHDDKREVYQGFLDRMEPAISLLRTAVQAKCSSSAAEHRLGPVLDEAISPEAYERFWRVCSTNAQALSHPSLAECALSVCAAESETSYLLELQGNAEGDDGTAHTGDALAQVWEALPTCAFRSVACTGLYPVLCRMNHDCRPNATVRSMLGVPPDCLPCAPADSEQGQVTDVGPAGVFALRAIRCGEEVCINYLGEEFEREGEKSAGVNHLGKLCYEELLERYAFRCSCSV